jgi:two-component system, cell cycle response regulator DivK
MVITVAEERDVVTSEDVQGTYRKTSRPEGTVRGRGTKRRRRADDRCTMSSPLVLVVDDSIDNLELTRILLENEGYEVRTAEDAGQALAVLETYLPILILMDIQLPEIDGLELTRRLRRDPAWQDVTIVALTAYAMRGDEEKARAAGCDGYITKPINTRAFGANVREYLKATCSAPLARRVELRRGGFR